MTFGEKLQRLRQGAGMSQDALAEQVGVSRQAVSRWERGETMPETDKVVMLAALFGVATDDLLRDVPEDSLRAAGSERRRPFRQNMGVLEQVLGWMLAAWGALDLLYLLTVGEAVELWIELPALALRACLFPTLYAGLKLAAGVWLIRFGKRGLKNKERR